MAHDPRILIFGGRAGMADRSGIEWTDATWNPVTGCTPVSPGCDHCYAERTALRLQAMGAPRYSRGFGLTLQPDVLGQPLRWKRPRTIFVNSMSDLFHGQVPLDYIREVFDAMCTADWHRYQILTKRAGRLQAVEGALWWRPHIWMGVSVEDAAQLWRVDALRSTGAAVKFLSLEPLLGDLPDLDLEGIDWVIVGGESGPGARPMDGSWVRRIRDRCAEARVPFFFKQWGGTNKKKAGRVLDGLEWNQMPRAA